MRVVYIRTSSKDQTPENQLRDICGMFVGNYEVFTDKQSAWREDKERGAFSEIYKLIKSGKVKELYVWDLDRIYRNRRRTIDFFKYCHIYDCKVFSFRQPFLNELDKIPKPFDEIVFDMMLQIMGWIAEEESNKKSDRVKLAVMKGKGKTMSKYGKKWGRKGLSKQMITKIVGLRSEKCTLREIADLLGISKSVVHKTLADIQREKSVEKGVVIN